MYLLKLVLAIIFFIFVNSNIWAQEEINDIDELIYYIHAQYLDGNQKLNHGTKQDRISVSTEEHDNFVGNNLSFYKFYVKNEEFTVCLNNKLEKSTICSIGYLGSKINTLLETINVLQKKFGENYFYLDFDKPMILNRFDRNDQNVIRSMKEDSGILWMTKKHLIVFTFSLVNQENISTPTYSFTLKFLQNNTNENYEHYLNEFKTTHKPNSIDKFGASFSEKFPERVPK